MKMMMMRQLAYYLYKLLKEEKCLKKGAQVKEGPMGRETV